MHIESEKNSFRILLTQRSRPRREYFASETLFVKAESFPGKGDWNRVLKPTQSATWCLFFFEQGK